VADFQPQTGDDPIEFADDPEFLVAFQFDQHMFFGREVEVEGASHHARRSGDCGYVSSGQSLSRDLGQRGIE
jgi:hypothetical protein